MSSRRLFSEELIRDRSANGTGPIVEVNLNVLAGPIVAAVPEQGQVPGPTFTINVQGRAGPEDTWTSVATLDQTHAQYVGGAKRIRTENVNFYPQMRVTLTNVADVGTGPNITVWALGTE